MSRPSFADMSTNDIVTVTEAATILGISRRTVLRRIATGQLPARKLGAATSSFVLKTRDVHAAAEAVDHHTATRAGSHPAAAPTKRGSPPDDY